MFKSKLAEEVKGQRKEGSKSMVVVNLRNAGPVSWTDDEK